MRHSTPDGKGKGAWFAALMRNRLHLDYFPDEHKWGGNKSVEFFTKYL